MDKLKSEKVNIWGMNHGDCIDTAPWNGYWKRIWRVPGGWIFTMVTPSGDSSTFVPFSMEFQEEDEGDYKFLDLRRNLHKKNDAND